MTLYTPDSKNRLCHAVAQGLGHSKASAMALFFLRSLRGGGGRGAEDLEDCALVSRSVFIFDSGRRIRKSSSLVYEDRNKKGCIKFYCTC